MIDAKKFYDEARAYRRTVDHIFTTLAVLVGPARDIAIAMISGEDVKVGALISRNDQARLYTLSVLIADADRHSKNMLQIVFDGCDNPQYHQATITRLIAEAAQAAGQRHLKIVT